MRRKGERDESCASSAKEEMKKSEKRVLTTAAACAMIGAMAFGGTMAYLTDNEASVNTFTVGKVQIELEEPGWDPGDGEEIVPNEEIEKDPKIENSGTNLAYVFAEVKIPAADVVTAAADGQKNSSALQDLFTYGTVRDDGSGEVYTAGGLNEGWSLLITEKAEESGGYSTYIFGYEKPLAKGESTPGVFDQVKFINLVEGQLDSADLDIPVKGYAIQADTSADGVTTIDGVKIENPALLTEEEMKAVYQVFAGQNSGFEDLTAVEGGLKDADTSGEKDLSGGEIA